MDGDAPNAQFATQLAKIYSDAADSLDAYIEANFDSLKQSGSLDAIQNSEQQLTTYSEQFIAISNDILFTGAEDCFTQLGDATNSIKQALIHIEEVNKIINIVACTVTLAENILTGNIVGIALAIKDIVGTAKAPAVDP